MNERPILFSAEMVRAILDGLKTQTRRVITPQPKSFGRSWYWTKEDVTVRESLVEIFDVTPHVIWAEEYLPSALSQFCPFGQLGDHLWVRETFGLLWRRETAFGDEFDEYTEKLSDIDRKLLSRVFRADDDFEPVSSNFWRPSIHMPRWASRMQLKIISVRVERLQEIDKKDACAEGVRWSEAFPEGYTASRPHCYDTAAPAAVYSFRKLWDQINANKKDKHGKILPYAWKDNPWVWVIEFERIKP